MRGEKGFTLIELLIVIVIMVIITGVSFVYLPSYNRGSAMKASVQQIAATLREAQNYSMSENGGVAWGVHFDNTASTPYYSLFSGTSTSLTGGQVILPAGICFATSSIPQGSSLNVSFALISGVPSASGTITIQSTGCAGGSFAGGNISSTITVSPQGLVSY